METTPHPFTALARVSTAVPRRYLGQVCKHFQHKLAVSFDERYETGRIAFSAGACALDADEEQGLLILHVEASNAEDLERLEDVVARHLVRFAFREPLDVVWVRG